MTDAASNLSLAELLAFDPGEYETMATAWRGLARDLDEAVDKYVVATRDLPNYWTGKAADTAWSTVSGIRTDLLATVQPAKDIKTSLGTYADLLANLKRRAADLVAEAEEFGFTVNAETGEIAPPPAAEADAIRRAGHKALNATAVREHLNHLLGEARRIDGEIARAIVDNTPGPGHRLRMSTTPNLSRADLEAQRGRSPAEVADWWNGLSPGQRADATVTYPDLVGSLDGIPVVTRDQANRINLAAQKQELEKQKIDLERARANEDASPDYRHQVDMKLDDVNGKLKGVAAIEARINRPGDPPAFLLGIDPDGDGRAIVAIGNPDTARHTAVVVPGMGTELQGMAGQMERAERVQGAAERVAGQSGTVAVVAWLGYDTPEDYPSAMADARAEQGAPLLDRFVDGLRATHGPGPNHVTAIGHSYGTVVVGEAAHGGDLHVDDIVTAGSPGMNVHDARDLNIDTRHVWAGAGEDDTIADGNYATGWGAYSGHGPHPQYEEFHGNRFRVDTHGHSGYWQENSESLKNQGRIVAGDYEHVSLDHGSGPS